MLEDNLPSIPSHNEANLPSIPSHNGANLPSIPAHNEACNTNISVLGITEAKLDSTVNNEKLKVDGYNLLRSDKNKNGGGVACYIKNNIAHNRKLRISENIENIVLDILLPK